MPNWAESLLRDHLPIQPLLAFVAVAAIHGTRAEYLYSNTHSQYGRSAKIATQIAVMFAVFMTAFGFSRLILWLLGIDHGTWIATATGFVILYIASLILFHIPLATTLNPAPLHPFKARDGAFEILLDRALVQEAQDAFARTVQAQLARFGVAAAELSELRDMLDPIEPAASPEEAVQEARSYWQGVLALLARKRPELALPADLLDHAAREGEAAAERMRASTTTRVARAVILAKFIDLHDDQASIPITPAEARRHPLFMRLAGLHAFLWTTIATVITASSVAVVIERPSYRVGLGNYLGQQLRSWIAGLPGGWFIDGMARDQINQTARTLDTSLQAVVDQLILSFNLLMQLLVMITAGACATLDPKIRQLVFAMSVGIFAYYLIAGRQFRYFFALYLWAYAALTLEMYYRYFLAQRDGSLPDRMAQLARAITNLPGMGKSDLAAAVVQATSFVGRLSGIVLAIPGTVIWISIAVYFTYYIFSKEAALVTFDKRMRKPGF